jgi:phosphoglycerate dehydrogenase-like enzyme
LAELAVSSMDLPTMFSECDVVSLHAPLIPATTGMITGELLARMKPGATFINTGRGALVKEEEMCEVLRQRPDLQAVLDVTYPDPPEANSPLKTLPNVFLTPHIAGSLGPECRRMGRMMMEEFQRFLAGQPLIHAVSREVAATRA